MTLIARREDWARILDGATDEDPMLRIDEFMCITEALRLAAPEATLIAVDAMPAGLNRTHGMQGYTARHQVATRIADNIEAEWQVRARTMGLRSVRPHRAWPRDEARTEELDAWLANPERPALADGRKQRRTGRRREVAGQG